MEGPIQLDAIIPITPTPSRTTSPPAQATRAEPTTCRDNHRVGISQVIPTSELLDNYGTHKHPNVQAWLAEHPRFSLHFIPTSSSWLNLVERWFRELTDKRIRRGSFTSVADLIEAIEDYIAHHNEDPKPYKWTKTAEEIIEKVRRGRVALADAQARVI